MKFIVSPLAQRQLEQKMAWYREFKGHDFSEAFYENVIATYRLISSMPTVGRIERKGDNAVLRSFPSHRNCRIYYSHNDTRIAILRLHFSPMRPVSASGLTINKNSNTN